MTIITREEHSNQCHGNSTIVELGIRSGISIPGNNASLVHRSIEHLVLQSGTMALQNMVQLFRQQIREDGIHIRSGQRKTTRHDKYREYEKNIQTILTPHWNGHTRGLKKYVRRSLKPFRKSDGLLNKLLSTPARITATACLMVMLNGHSADSFVLHNSTHDNRQSNFAHPAKQKASYRDEIFTNSPIAKEDVSTSVDFIGTADKGKNVEIRLVTGKANDRATASIDYSPLFAIPNSGQVIAGDGSGGGGGGAGAEYYSKSGGPGGDGGGGNDILTGTTGNDILFGDGSGGGGGDNINLLFFSGSSPVPPSPGGTGGGGNDTLTGGGGNDIMFGDGFDGFDAVSSGGGAGGFGGGGGGAGHKRVHIGDPGGSNGGDGGIGAGGGGSGGLYSVGGTSDLGGEDGENGSYNGGGNGGSAFSGIAGGIGCDGGGGGGGFGGGTGGSGGCYNVSGGTGNAGTDGGIEPVTFADDFLGTAYNYVKIRIETLSTLPGGSGHDILDGGAGSDDLFGMGGKNMFIFESDDAFTGSDIDTIYDWNQGSGNWISLQTGGIKLEEAQILSIVAAQTANGDDRSIIHSDGPNQVTIVVKGLGRDLTSSDFKSVFPWGMFLPAIITP